MISGIWRKKAAGNVADIMITGIFILAMAVVMLAFMDDMELIRQKTEISQIARQYILRMETTGGLLQEDCVSLLRDLEEQKVTDVNLEGTTLGQTGYGEKITLVIKGNLGGKYGFVEKRVSTAKY